MKLLRQIRLFDIGMLMLAALPFCVMYLLAYISNSEWRGSVAIILAYLIFVPTCLGFPMASFLYFVWRFSGSKYS